MNYAHRNGEEMLPDVIDGECYNYWFQGEGDYTDWHEPRPGFRVIDKVGTMEVEGLMLVIQFPDDKTGNDEWEMCSEASGHFKLSRVRGRWWGPVVPPYTPREDFP